jgi:hypothetical protein
MARASTPTNGLKMLVAACMIALIDGALNTGSFVGHLLLPITTYTQTPKRAWSRTDGIEPPARDDEPRVQTTAPCISREQRNQAGGNVGHNCQRSRVEHVRRLYYHSRPTDSINRITTTVMMTTTRTPASASTTIPPIHDVEHEQHRTVHSQLKHSALILHSADTTTSATDHQVDFAPPRR